MDLAGIEDDYMLWYLYYTIQCCESMSHILHVALYRPDAILTAGPLRVVEEVTRDKEGPGGKAKVLVSADGLCWPDKDLAKSFPKPAKGRRFIDAGGEKYAWDEASL